MHAAGKKNFRFFYCNFVCFKSIWGELCIFTIFFLTPFNHIFSPTSRLAMGQTDKREKRMSNVHCHHKSPQKSLRVGHTPSPYSSILLSGQYEVFARACDTLLACFNRSHIIEGIGFIFNKLGFTFNVGRRQSKGSIATQ